MHRVFAGVLGVLILCTGAAVWAAEAEKTEAPPAQLDWRKDLPFALEEAAATGRPVLVYFRADWCQPCLWIDKGSFGNKPMVTYITRHFVPLCVDDSVESSPLSEQFGVRTYPTILFLTGSGDVLHRVLEPLKPREFLDVLNQVRVLPTLLRTQEEAPEDSEANFALGNAFSTLGHLHRAHPYLKQAIDLDPENAHGHRGQASLMLAMEPLEDGDADTTLANLNRFLAEFEGEPEIPTAMFYVGKVLFGNGQLEEAREALVRLQEAFPKHAITYSADKMIEVIDAQILAKELAEKAKDANQPSEVPEEPEKPENGSETEPDAQP